MQQQGDVNTPRKRGVNVRKLLWWAGIIIVLGVLARSVLQSQGIGLPGSSTTGSSAGPGVAPSATPQSPTATPQTTKIQGKTVVGVPGPIILMNPGIVRTGTNVSVSGFGFDPQAQLDLVIKQGAGTGHALATVYADKTGSFTASFPLPPGLASGPFVVQAQQRNSDKAAQSTGSVTNGAAFVKLGAEVGKVGDMVGWSGSGFASGETVSVYWNSLGSQPLANFHADGGGSIKATVQVPFAAIGENSFIFVGTKSQSPVTASFLVLTLYPTVKPSSYALQADNPMSFSGVGFGPNERVLIFLNSMNGPPIGTAQTDEKGNFKNAGTILLPFTLKGKQTIVFIGEQSRAPTTIGFTILPYTPIAQASIYGGLPGTTLSFYASNFARNEVVHVYIGRGQGGGGNMVACFQTNGKGQAGAAGSYVIPGNAQGKLVFTLVGSESGASAAAVVTVMPSAVPVQIPAQPPFTCPLDQPAQNPAQAPAGGTPGGQAPQAPAGGGAAPGGQAPQAPAGGNPGGGAAPGDQGPQPPQPPQPPQAPTGANPTGQVPQLPTAAHSALQPRLAQPVPAVSLALLTGLASGGMSASHRVAETQSSAITRRHKSPPVHAPAPPDFTGGISIPSWITISGLVWLGLIAVLGVLLLVRAGFDWRREMRAWTYGLDAYSGEAGHSRSQHLRSQMPLTSATQAPSAVERTAVAHGVAADGVSQVRLVSHEHDLGWPMPRIAPAGARSVPVFLAGGERGLVPQVAGVVDVGITRRVGPNEDSLLMLIAHVRVKTGLQPFGLFVVADSLGGCESGKEASHRTTEIIADRTLARLAGDRPVGAISFTGVLAQAVASANAELCAQNDVRHTNVGATVTAALLTGDVAHIVNVGHSRTYAYSPMQGLRQVTKDHTIIAGLVAAQLLPPIAMYTHPRRRQLHRCLGRQDYSQVDTFQIIVEPEDRIMLCSSGLWEMVRDPEIESILRAVADPHLAAQKLVAVANRNGGQNTISVIVARTLGDLVMPEVQPCQLGPEAHA
jgi:serine/threonine protein phosphatase PrpC